MRQISLREALTLFRNVDIAAENDRDWGCPEFGGGAQSITYVNGYKVYFGIEISGFAGSEVTLPDLDYNVKIILYEPGTWE